MENRQEKERDTEKPAENEGKMGRKGRKEGRKSLYVLMKDCWSQHNHAPTLSFLITHLITLLGLTLTLSFNSLRAHTPHASLRRATARKSP